MTGRVQDCPCDTGSHRDCDWWYDGCCCHNQIIGGIDWMLRDDCPPGGCSCDDTPS